MQRIILRIWNGLPPQRLFLTRLKTGKLKCRGGRRIRSSANGGESFLIRFPGSLATYNVQRTTTMEKLGNSKYLVINTIATDPAFQGQGVCSELLRWATELADKEQISIWTQVPKAASILFASAGSPFVVDIIDPNEFSFARIPEGYKITFMVREARFNSEERSAFNFQRLYATILSQNSRSTVRRVASISQ